MCTEKLQVLGEQILKGVHANRFNKAENGYAVHLPDFVEHQRSVLVELAVIELLIVQQRQTNLVKIFEVDF